MQFLWSPNHCNRFALIQDGIHLYNFQQLPQQTTQHLISPISSSFPPTHPLNDPIPFPAHTYSNPQFTQHQQSPPVCNYLGSIPLFPPTQSISFLRSTPIPATRNCLTPVSLCWQPNGNNPYAFTMGYESGLIFTHTLGSDIDSSLSLHSPPDYNPFQTMSHYSTAITPPVGANVLQYSSHSALTHVFEHPVGCLTHNPYYPNLLAATSTNQTRSSPSFVLLDINQASQIPTSMLSTLSFPTPPDPLISQSFGTIFTASWVPSHPTQIVLGCKKFLRLLDLRDSFQVRTSSTPCMPYPSSLPYTSSLYPQSSSQYQPQPSFTMHANANQRIRQHSLRTHESLNMVLSIDDSGRYLATNAYNGNILLYDLRMLAAIEPEVESSVMGSIRQNVSAGTTSLSTATTGQYDDRKGVNNHGSVDYVAFLDSREHLLHTKSQSESSSALPTTNTASTSSHQSQHTTSSRFQASQQKSQATSQSYATSAQFFANFFWGRQANSFLPLSSPPISQSDQSIHTQPAQSHPQSHGSTINLTSLTPFPAPLRTRTQPKNILYITDNTGLCAYDLTTHLSMIRTKIVPPSSKLRPPRSILLLLNHKLVSSTQTIVSTQTFPLLHTTTNTLRRSTFFNHNIPNTASITLSAASSSKSLQYTINIDILRSIPRPKYSFSSLPAFSQLPPVPPSPPLLHFHPPLSSNRQSTLTSLLPTKQAEQQFFSPFFPNSFMHSWSTPPILEITSALQSKFLQLLSTQCNLHTFLNNYRTPIGIQSQISTSQLVHLAMTPQSTAQLPHLYPQSSTPTQQHSPEHLTFSQFESTLISLTSLLTSFTTPLSLQPPSLSTTQPFTTHQHDHIPFSQLLIAFQYCISNPAHFLSFMNPSLRLLVGYNLDSINSNSKTLLMLIQSAFAHRAILSYTFSLFALYFSALSVCYSVLENIGPISSMSLSSTLGYHTQPYQHHHQQQPNLNTSHTSRRILDAITLLTIHQNILTNLTTQLMQWNQQFQILLTNPLLFTNVSMFTYLNPISSQFFQQSIIIPTTFSTTFYLLQRSTNNALTFFDATLFHQIKLLSTWFYIKGVKLFPSMNTKHDFLRILTLISTSVLFQQSQHQLHHIQSSSLSSTTISSSLNQNSPVQDTNSSSPSCQNYQKTSSNQQILLNDPLSVDYQLLIEEITPIPYITTIESQLHQISRFNALGPLHWASLLQYAATSAASSHISSSRTSLPPQALGYSLKLTPSSFLSLSQPRAHNIIQNLLSHTTSTPPTHYINAIPSSSSQQSQQSQQSTVQLLGLTAPTVPSFHALEIIPTHHHPLRTMYSLPTTATLTSLLSFLGLAIPLTNSIHQQTDLMNGWFLPLSIFEKKIHFVVNHDNMFSSTKTKTSQAQAQIQNSYTFSLFEPIPFSDNLHSGIDENFDPNSLRMTTDLPSAQNPEILLIHKARAEILEYFSHVLTVSLFHHQQALWLHFLQYTLSLANEFQHPLPQSSSSNRTHAKQSQQQQQQQSSQSASPFPFPHMSISDLYVLSGTIALISREFDIAITCFASPYTTIPTSLLQSVTQLKNLISTVPISFTAQSLTLQQQTLQTQMKGEKYQHLVTRLFQLFTSIMTSYQVDCLGIRLTNPSSSIPSFAHTSSAVFIQPSITSQFAYLILIFLTSIAAIAVNKHVNLSYRPYYDTLLSILYHLPPPVQLWLLFTFFPDDQLYPTLSLITKFSINSGSPTSLYYTGLHATQPVIHPITIIAKSIKQLSFFTFHQPPHISSPLHTLLSLFIQHTNQHVPTSFQDKSHEISTKQAQLASILHQLQLLHKSALFSTTCTCQSCVLCAMKQCITTNVIDIQSPTYFLTYIGAVSLLDADTNRTLITSILQDRSSAVSDHNSFQPIKLSKHLLSSLFKTLPKQLLNLLINPFLSYLRLALVQYSGAYKEYLNRSILGLLKPFAMDFDFQRQHVMALICGRLYTPTLNYHIPHCTSCGSLHYNDPSIEDIERKKKKLIELQTHLNNGINDGSSHGGISNSTGLANQQNISSGNNGMGPGPGLETSTTATNKTNENAGSHNRLRCRVCKSTWPLCALCYQPVGGNEDSVPTDKAFIWCLDCKHGGHVHHMIQWFTLVDTCPHPDCDCRCALRSNSSM